MAVRRRRCRQRGGETGSGMCSGRERKREKGARPRIGTEERRGRWWMRSKQTWTSTAVLATSDGCPSLPLSPRRAGSVRLRWRWIRVSTDSVRSAWG